MPLALELAAARIRSLSVAQIAELLGDSLSLLTTGARTALPRQQTLRATIDWSYDLLSEKEQALFRRLAVFAGSFTLDAVEAICAAAPLEQVEVLDLLSSLVSKSLVVAQAHSTMARYKLLETVWQYARQKLEEAGELSTLGKLHRDWYLALAERAQPELRCADQFAWLSRLDDEMANLRVAMQWSTSDGDNSEALLHLTVALWWFWALRSYLSEGRRRLREALERGAGISSAAVYGKALTAAGALAWLQSDLEEARAILEKSVAYWRELGDEHGLAYALMFLGEVTLYQGSPAQACTVDGESVTRLRQTGDTWGLALALACLAEAAGTAGDYEFARSVISESLALFRETGDSWGIALSTSQFGWLAFRRGDYATARLLFEEGLPIWKRFGDKWHIVSTLGYLAQIAQAENDFRQAVPMYGEQLPIFRELGQMRGLATTLARLAAIAHALGQVRTSALLLAAADATGSPVISGYTEHFESQIATARVALGTDFAAVWGEGRSMSHAWIDSEIERLALLGSRDARSMAAQTPAQSTGYPGGLTAREVEVLRLVAEGLTDAQAAERLVVSTRTVNSHLRSIYSKLGISSRSAAGRFAAEHGLI
jgi:non-specific serine/threonine protein kinase